jgi:ribonuclease VapC
MIVVDSSAVVAIMRQEEDADIYEDALDRADGALISTVSFVETSMVICGRREGASPDSIRKLLEALEIEILPVSLTDGHAAVDAFLKFGKGRHPARLNMADCFSYALAKNRNLPLLFKGNDFTQTDIRSA